VSETARSTDAMQIRLCVLGKVEVDNHVDRLDINTTRQKIRANKVPAHAIAEVVKDAVTVVLEHAGMRIKAGVSKLGDLLGEELDTVRRVTEDDRLVDLELVEESIQAVHFLLLLDKGIVLCDTAERQLVHQVDFVW